MMKEMKTKRTTTGMVKLSGQKMRLKGDLMETLLTKVPHTSIS